MKLPAKTAPINVPLRPQFPSQPNPNPNKKAMQQVETLNIPSYSITDIPCNKLHLQFGRVVEPIIIEDVPTPVTGEGTNK